MITKKFVSIIFVHYGMNGERSEIMRKSIDSLIDSIDYPSEIIVADNGQSNEDSSYLLLLTHQKKINTYIRNAENMHFGFARNQGLAMANGEYICIADNDILYRKGWLSDSIKVLEKYPDNKIYATPVFPIAHDRDKFWMGELIVEDKSYRLNMRAGSNCWVMRKKDFQEVGNFAIHRVAGTLWTNKAVKKGYLAAVVPGDLVEDLGYHIGYNLTESKPVNLVLTDGSKVYFNSDEFWEVNQSKFQFMSQQKF